MQRHVAVGADRYEVTHGVHHVLRRRLVKRHHVVHLDDARKLRAIGLGKVKAADGAGGAMGLDAGLPGGAAGS